MTAAPEAAGPGLAGINREAYIYFGAGAAVAWQMADPTWAAGSHAIAPPSSGRWTGCARR